MAFCDDPAHHWVRDAWDGMALDPRCPMTAAGGRRAMRQRLGIGVVGFGWMGQAHSRSYRRIPTLFPDRVADPVLVVCADAVEARRRRGGRGLRVRARRPTTGARSSSTPTSTSSSSPRRTCSTSRSPRPPRRPARPCSARSRSAARRRRRSPPSGRPRHVVTGVGYNYRWAPLVQYAKSLVDAGRLGRITNYRGRFLSCYGNDPLGAAVVALPRRPGRPRRQHRPAQPRRRPRPAPRRPDHRRRRHRRDVHPRAAAADRRRHPLRPGRAGRPDRDA